MQIGEPIRTIVVEPLEFPVNQPTGEPEPVSVPKSDSERLHDLTQRFTCLLLPAAKKATT
jgi:hypothetical protein